MFALRALAVELRAFLPPLLYPVGGLGPLMTRLRRGHERFRTSFPLLPLESLVLVVEDSFDMLPRGLFSTSFQHSPIGYILRRESIQNGDFPFVLSDELPYPP